MNGGWWPRCRSEARWLCLSLVVGCGASEKPPAATVQVTVDFAHPEPGTKSMVGFLHAMDAVDPPQDQIAPLMPKLWRAGTLTSRIYERATLLGARYMVAVSDYWGYPSDPKIRPPYEDFSAWEGRVREIARASKGRPAIFDIWNEPNGAGFWWGALVDDVSQQRFLETFRRAYDVIRDELGDQALVTGPSLAITGPSQTAGLLNMLKTFVEYCQSHAIQVDILNWHEFREDKQLSAMQTALLDARRAFIDAPLYSNVKIREILIPESVPEAAHLRPGSNLAFFFHMERGRADGAARACWSEPNSSDTNCWNNTLEGLLTPKPFARRSVWWATQAYAESVLGRVTSTTSDSRLISYASHSTSVTNEALVLIGYYDVGPSNPPPITIEVQLDGISQVPFLKGHPTISWVAYKLPNSGVTALPEPEVSARGTANIEGDSARFTLPALALYEAATVKVTPQ